MGPILLVIEVWVLCYAPPPQGGNFSCRCSSIIKPGILASEVELAGGVDVKRQVCAYVENISENWGCVCGGGLHSQLCGCCHPMQEQRGVYVEPD